jgi:hypothetical protein
MRNETSIFPVRSEYGTFSEVPVTQASPPKDLQLDGTNIWSAFVGKGSVPERAICYPPNAIRQGKWKMIGGKLFDLETDLAERNDVAAQHPDVCLQLFGQLKAWQQERKIKAAATTGKKSAGHE